MFKKVNFISPQYYCICKKCREFAKVNTSIVLTSLPPQYNYYCDNCGNHGYTKQSEFYINK